MNDKSVIRKSNYFVMYKDVHRPHRGRGSKFQNHKVTSYKIKPLGRLPSKLIDEARTLANPDHVRVPADPLKYSYYQTWKFYSKQAADRAWMLLLLKYGD